ncbi:MAG: DNA polymerase III subunit delta [Bacteroidetes bacterium]|mgnify:CR=1 FL=1|nr:DNA polymerase III subunit delta [Bacteroidota bacterium]MBS1982156.1 DNA polymerase III subunit delta [Bacteroidota bacterium]
MDALAKKILEKLKKGKYDPVYLLQGEETYYIDLLSNYIETNALTEGEKGFNQVILYGKDSPMAAILTCARRFPMMAERQVVIVREAQDIPDLNKDTGSKLLLDYLTQPVPSTVLVLCHKHKTLDKRRELGKKAEQLATSAAFKKPYDNQLIEFIVKYIEEKKYSIDEEAARVLAEYVGNDLNRLANEADKILISHDAKEPIRPTEVMAKVGISREYNIFELQRALVSKDWMQVAKIINYFEANPKKNPAIPMVAFLYSFFSKVLAAHSVQDRSPQGLTAALKINPYSAKEYSAAVQRFSQAKALEIVSLLRQADLKLKGVNSGNEDEGQILKELVFRMLV